MRYARNTLDGGIDRNCCAVLAVAAALDTSYNDAAALFAARGRKRNHRTPRHITRGILAELGARPPVLLAGGVPLARFQERFPLGTFVAFTCNHAFVLKNGVVLDPLNYRPRCIVKEYIPVFES